MKRRRHVAVLIETSRAFGRGLIEGVARYSREHGPWSMYLEPHGLIDPPPKWLRDWKGDGILARVNDQRMLKAVWACGLPALDLRGALPLADTKLPLVGTNNDRIVRLVVEHFLERGIRQFGFCGVPRGKNRVVDQRCDEFTRLVEQAGYTCQVYYLRSSQKSTPDWESEQAHLGRWVKRLPKPVGVMACHDDRGQQLLDACRRVAVSVPDEVAVVGVDNDLILCFTTDPPMSSVDPAAQRVGFEAAALLDRMMRGGKPPGAPILLEPVRVVARQSSDMLAIDDPDVATAVRLVRERACDGMSVEDLVQELMLSHSTLNRHFKKYVGRPIKAEMLRVRIDRAKQLLTETGMSMGEIARRTSFSSEKYLNDTFHRISGVRPGMYRRHFRRVNL